jgi:hypothetical protein
MSNYTTFVVLAQVEIENRESMQAIFDPTYCGLGAAEDSLVRQPSNTRIPVYNR